MGNENVAANVAAPANGAIRQLTCISLGQHFEHFGERTTGFDYLRIGLAMGVLVWHSYALTYGYGSIERILSTPHIGFWIHLILPMFFALSGFLVTASLMRSKSIKTYLAFRGLRIFPALGVEITLAALLLGPIVTGVSLGQYFSDGLLYKYFLNVAGLVQLKLPGVFTNNPYPEIVNGSLWTIPYELECYILLMIAYILGAFRRRWSLLILFAIGTLTVAHFGAYNIKGLVVFLKEMVLGKTPDAANLQELGTEGSIQISRIIVLSFLAGGVLYAFKDKVPYHWGLAILAFLLTAILLTSNQLYFYAPLPIAYVTAWLGAQMPPLWSLLKRGDYSYGIYLYAFPIQQAVMHWGWSDNFFVTAILSTFLSGGFAFLSWHYVEKPCLGLKRHFK